MIYLYLFGTCFHFIYVFMIIGNKHFQVCEPDGTEHISQFPVLCMLKCRSRSSSFP